MKGRNEDEMINGATFYEDLTVLNKDGETIGSFQGSIIPADRDFAKPEYIVGIVGYNDVEMAKKHSTRSMVCDLCADRNKVFCLKSTK